MTRRATAGRHGRIAHCRGQILDQIARRAPHFGLVELRHFAANRPVERRRCDGRIHPTLDSGPHQAIAIGRIHRLAMILPRQLAEQIFRVARLHRMRPVERTLIDRAGVGRIGHAANLGCGLNRRKLPPGYNGTPDHSA